MIFDKVRELVTVRFLEVRRLLLHIKVVEAAKAEDPVVPEDAAFLRGLFYVHLYGAFEYSVSTSVAALLEGISGTQVPYSELEHLFHSVALHTRFEAAESSRFDRKLERRRELLRQQISSEPCLLDESVLSGQLQNIWGKTLDELFSSLCIDRPIVPEIRLRGYVDQVVNHRNEVSHGRSSAGGIGRMVTSTDLERVLEAILSITNHLVDRFDEYYSLRQFIAATYRERYMQPSE